MSLRLHDEHPAGRLHEMVDPGEAAHPVRDQDIVQRRKTAFSDVPRKELLSERTRDARLESADAINALIFALGCDIREQREIL